jgi:hypothetical protein
MTIVSEPRSISVETRRLTIKAILRESERSVNGVRYENGLSQKEMILGLILGQSQLQEEIRQRELETTNFCQTL